LVKVRKDGTRPRKRRKKGRKKTTIQQLSKVHRLAEEKKSKRGLGPDTYLWHRIAQLLSD
jgi:hypothetical protein